MLKCKHLYSLSIAVLCRVRRILCLHKNGDISMVTFLLSHILRPPHSKKGVVNPVCMVSVVSKLRSTIEISWCSWDCFCIWKKSSWVILISHACNYKCYYRCYKMPKFDHNLILNLVSMNALFKNLRIMKKKWK